VCIRSAPEKLHHAGRTLPSLYAISPNGVVSSCRSRRPGSGPYRKYPRPLPDIKILEPIRPVYRKPLMLPSPEGRPVTRGTDDPCTGFRSSRKPTGYAAMAVPALGLGSAQTPPFSASSKACSCGRPLAQTGRGSWIPTRWHSRSGTINRSLIPILQTASSSKRYWNG